MSGKPREDRGTIASHHLGLRLTDDEHAQLAAIVTDANAKMSAAGIPGIQTSTSMVRWLIATEFKNRRLSIESEPRKTKSPAAHMEAVAKATSSMSPRGKGKR